jgi:diaminopimelate decarboxylase
LICFSMKANSNLAVLKTLVLRGAGLDIVSAGELYKALKVSCPTNRIVYASVGKRPDEIEEAIKRDILLFNVESEPELLKINNIAGKQNKKVSCALRLNPDVNAGTHKYITTGKGENKFGLDFKTAAHIFKNASKYANIEISGIHIHIGSQITEAVPFKKAILKTLEFVDSLKIDLKYFNIGGGLAIIYGGEKAQTASEFAGKVMPCFKGRTFRLILEPGRFVVGNSGVLVTKVVYVKNNPSGKKFAIVDAGMNDLIRPSLYEAYHEVLPVTAGVKAKKLMYDIVGPICESGDFLAKDRKIAELRAGDLLAVMGAGAYGFTMSSNYNSRPRIKEIMVVNKRPYIVKEAETYEDLIRGERVPAGI